MDKINATEHILQPMFPEQFLHLRNNIASQHMVRTSMGHARQSPGNQKSARTSRVYFGHKDDPPGKVRLIEVHELCCAARVILLLTFVFLKSL